MNGLNNTGEENNMSEGAFKQRPRTRVANRHRTPTDIALSEQKDEQTPERKKSGWGEVKDTKSPGLLGKVLGLGKRESSSSTSEVEEEVNVEEEYRGEVPKYMEEDEEDGSSAAIPTLSGNQDLDPAMNKIADAPDYHGNRVQSIGELDKDLVFSLPPLRKPLDSHLDLSVLSTALAPSDQIIEEDTQWTRATFTRLLHGE